MPSVTQVLGQNGPRMAESWLKNVFSHTLESVLVLVQSLTPNRVARAMPTTAAMTSTRRAERGK